MPVDQHRALLYGGAAALRLLLSAAFPGLPTLLAGRVEVSTPVTSFKRLQEGLFLYTHNVSPYDGGLYHQAPLLLPLFSLLPNPAHYPVATDVVFTVVDLVGAHALAQVAESGAAAVSRLFSSSRKELRWSSAAVAAGFLYNPFTILTCLARSTSALTNMCILTAMAKASQGASITFVLALSFAAYLAMHPILLFPPLLVLLYDARAAKTKSTHNAWSFTIAHTIGLAAVSAALLSASALLTGSWDFMAATYGVRLLLPDLTPNVGLWWYFFIEMFDSFREFFLGVFWLHAASYMPGLTIRLYKQPLFVACTLTGIFAVFTPYPSIADAALYLSLVPLFRHLFPLMRYTFVASAAVLYASFLGPAFYYLWIYAGSGNANFFYAITLVWSLGLSIIIGDSLFAALRDELDVERPELQGKDVRRI
ncbi:Phosphatidylinositol glycan anchor biosynthesis class U protein [Stagonosporopsis vannaccii]|nr:Phosphatidylinositol glycan anchor biosynthesis class U protein [Stagonosporopsis vannaccii]